MFVGIVEEIIIYVYVYITWICLNISGKEFFIERLLKIDIMLKAVNIWFVRCQNIPVLPHSVNRSAFKLGFHIEA